MPSEDCLADVNFLEILTTLPLMMIMVVVIIVQSMGVACEE